MVVLKEDEVFGGEQPVEFELGPVYGCGEAGQLTRPGVDVGHPDEPLLVHKHIFRLDVS